MDQRNTSRGNSKSTTGEVTGVTLGNPTIFYSVQNGCGTSTKSYNISVTSAPNPGTISGPTTVCMNSNMFLSTNGAPGGTWSSGTPAIATVNATTGQVFGVTAGPVIIRYTVTNSCGSNSVDYNVTVTLAGNPGTISGPNTVCAGSTINLSTSGTGGTWSSGTPNVATVDPNTGIVTGVAQGNSTISYSVTTSCGTVSATYLVTVNTQPGAPNVGPQNVCSGTTVASLPTNGGTYRWYAALSDVSPLDGSVVLATGTYYVSQVSGSCESSRSAVAVNVSTGPNVAPIAGGAATVCVGSNTPAFTDATAGGTWGITNGTGSAGITTGGVVNGLTAGTVTVTYSVTNSCGTTTVQASLTVLGTPSVAPITGGAPTVCSGSATPAFADVTEGGTWSI